MSTDRRPTEGFNQPLNASLAPVSSFKPQDVPLQHFASDAIFSGMLEKKRSTRNKSSSKTTGEYEELFKSSIYTASFSLKIEYNKKTKSIKLTWGHNPDKPTIISREFLRAICIAEAMSTDVLDCKNVADVSDLRMQLLVNLILHLAKDKGALSSGYLDDSRVKAILDDCVKGLSKGKLGYYLAGREPDIKERARVLGDLLKAIDKVEWGTNLMTGSVIRLRQKIKEEWKSQMEVCINNFREECLKKRKRRPG